VYREQPDSNPPESGTDPKHSYLGTGGNVKKNKKNKDNDTNIQTGTYSNVPVPSYFPSLL
jgi:hypothetical protein